jgi:hypothetical protein
MNNDLLLFLQALDYVDRNLKHICDNVRRRKSQPLRQRDIGNTLRLIDLDEGQILRLRRVLNVVACSSSAAITKLSHGPNLPELSGKTAVSPGLKLKVRELLFPVNTVARASPSWK